MFSARISFAGKDYTLDLKQPIDLSLPLRSGAQNPNAFHIPSPRFEPIRVGDFVGSVAQGSGANCENLFLNAHGNGTHTECVGHITLERITINACLKHFHFSCQVLTVETTQVAGGSDHIIPLEAASGKLIPGVEAVVFRSLPNGSEKQLAQYSGANPTYFDPALCAYLAQQGVKHLLTDLPSVDREEDGGAMAAHKAWWQFPEHIRLDASISEMVFVPNETPDGLYLLNLQIASFESDASPSKPVLYKLNALG